jgi:putative protease
VPENEIELLAPARDLDCGTAAIDCGADAVYIGAPRFGARAAAGNTPEDIAALARHAHRFRARVYATLNTLLRDDEIDAAVRLAWELHEAGVDGLIIQDVGLLECELPPLPLIASTQMHNHTPERVAFLETAGFHRAILARELTLAEIRAVRRAAPRMEIECFVHGALCVCYSGQCLLSYALGGRSGNRGECAQPCRKPYTLEDAAGRVLIRDRHLLSIRDLNLSEDLPALLAAGVTSFKIEGRLKDRAYVSNVVAHYSARLNALGVRRASSGRSLIPFSPDLSKTFNRGYTKYFLHGRKERIGAHATPKMVGEPVLKEAAHPADGLCWFDASGRLVGGRPADAPEGTQVYRNHDHVFLESLRGAVRKIGVSFTVLPDRLRAVDEDGFSAEVMLPDGPAAEKPEIIRRQLARTGGTHFECTGVEIVEGRFLPVATWNALRRDVLERLWRAGFSRRGTSVPPTSGAEPPRRLKPAIHLNRYAQAFYKRYGIDSEPAAEYGLDLRGRTVMTTRYCLRYELGWCGRDTAPLFLRNAEGDRLELRFDCTRCEMEVVYHEPHT